MRKVTREESERGQERGKKPFEDIAKTPKVNIPKVKAEPK